MNVLGRWRNFKQVLQWTDSHRVDTLDRLPVRMLATMIQGGRGGVYRYVLELSRRLDINPRVHLELDCLRGEEHLLPTGAHLRRAPRWDRGGILDLARAQAAARAPQRGVLHVPSYRRAPWLGGDRVVVTVHDLAPLHIPDKFGRARHTFLTRFVPFALERCAHIIAVTEHTRQDLIEQFRLDPHKITAIPNGIDHERFQPDDRTAALARAQTVFPKLARDFVLYLARIEHPGKGHIPLLDAWARLRARRPDVPQLVFAGAAVERASEVFKHAQQLGLAPLCTGYVDDSVMADLYRSCSLFVFPSLYEGFGLPPVEAMACGAPVASSRRAALSETAGPAAVLDPGSPDSMASTLERLLDSDDERAQLSQAGLRWSARFDWDETVRRTLAVYQSVVR